MYGRVSFEWYRMKSAVVLHSFWFGAIFRDVNPNLYTKSHNLVLPINFHCMIIVKYYKYTYLILLNFIWLNFSQFKTWFVPKENFTITQSLSTDLSTEIVYRF